MMPQAPNRNGSRRPVRAAPGRNPEEHQCRDAVVGDQTYPSQKNDIFVVPNWTWWEVEARDDLVLLSYSDRAAPEKLDLWREQRANEPVRL
jgi:gentisate 1,2-dioxygenase